MGGGLLANAHFLNFRILEMIYEQPFSHEGNETVFQYTKKVQTEKEPQVRARLSQFFL